jgi:hypothetical protein
MIGPLRGENVCGLGVTFHWVRTTHRQRGENPVRGTHHAGLLRTTPACAGRTPSPPAVSERVCNLLTRSPLAHKAILAEVGAE